MNKMKFFCFGFGQVAKYFVKKLLKENYTLELNVSSRQKTQTKTFEGLNFNSYEFSNKKIDKRFQANWMFFD